MAENTAAGPCYLPGLAQELQDIIFNYLYPPREVTIYPGYRIPAPFPACKALYNTVRPIFYDNVTFRASRKATCLKWLRNLPEDSSKRIKTIKLKFLEKHLVPQSHFWETGAPTMWPTDRVIQDTLAELKALNPYLGRDVFKVPLRNNEMEISWMSRPEEELKRLGYAERKPWWPVTQGVDEDDDDDDMEDDDTEDYDMEDDDVKDEDLDDEDEDE